MNPLANSSSQQTDQCLIETLPKEIHKGISVYLSMGDLAKCCCVSKAWSEVFDMSYMWETTVKREIHAIGLIEKESASNLIDGQRDLVINLVRKITKQVLLGNGDIWLLQKLVIDASNSMPSECYRYRIFFYVWEVIRYDLKKNEFIDDVYYEEILKLQDLMWRKSEEVDLFSLPQIDDEPSLSCSVCSGTPTDQKVTLACFHVFHKTCIDTWAAKNNHCPTCHFSIIRINPNEAKSEKLIDCGREFLTMGNTRLAVKITLHSIAVTKRENPHAYQIHDLARALLCEITNQMLLSNADHKFLLAIIDEAADRMPNGWEKYLVYLIVLDSIEKLKHEYESEGLMNDPLYLAISAFCHLLEIKCDDASDFKYPYN